MLFWLHQLVNLKQVQTQEVMISVWAIKQQQYPINNKSPNNYPGLYYLLI